MNRVTTALLGAGSSAAVFLITIAAMDGASPRAPTAALMAGLVAVIFLILHPLQVFLIRTAWLSARGGILVVAANALLAVVLVTALFHETGQPLLPTNRFLMEEFVPWYLAFFIGGAVTWLGRARTGENT